MSSAPSEQQQKDLRHLLVAGGTNALALIAGVSLTVFHTLAARVFGKALFGLYAFSTAAIEILMTVGGLATDKGLTRYIAAHSVEGEDTRAASALGTGFWLTALSSAFVALLAYAFADRLAALFGQPAAGRAISLLSPSILFGQLMTVTIWGTIAAKVMRYKLFVKELAYPLLLMAGALPLGLYAPRLEVLCGAHVLATLLALLAGIWALKTVYAHLPLSRALFRSPVHWEMVRYCLPMALTDPLGVISQRASSLIIGPFVTSGQIAVFSASDMLSRAIGGATMAFDPVIMPILSEAAKQGDRERVRYNLQLTSRWVAVICLPIIIFFLLFRNELLLLYGRGFAEGSTTLLIFILGRIISAILGLSAWVLPMSGRSKTVLANQVVVSLVSVVSCYLLTSRFGIEGAAGSWLLSTAVAYGLVVVEIYLFEGAHPFSGGMFRAMAVSLVTWLAMSQLLPYLPSSVWLKLSVCSIGTLLLYGALFAVFARTEQDDQLLRMLRLKK